MAVAKAQCTCATCGKQFEYRTYKSNRREADSFEEWAAEHITECEDCKAKRIQQQRDEENAKSAEAAREMGYPALQGSEKQIAWAMTIRDKFIATVREKIMMIDTVKHQYIRLAYKPILHVLLQKRQAGWWIDHSSAQSDMIAINRIVAQLDEDLCKAVSAIQKAVKDGEKTMEQAEAEIDVLIAGPQETKAEAQKEEEKPVRYEAVTKRVHAGSVDIHVEGDVVTAVYDKDESFRQIVKGMGFTWGACWSLKAGEKTGDAANIVAELGNRLLNAGFAVRFDSETLMDRAVAGSYDPMCRRWIQSHTTGFAISWPREDDLYRAAVSLPGARYQAPGVIVPERSWAAVMDFASRYGFRLTAKAKAKMDKLSGAAQTVTPAPVKEPVYDEHDVLKTSREVIEDLKD